MAIHCLVELPITEHRTDEPNTDTGRATLDYFEWIKDRVFEKLDLTPPEVIKIVVICAICHHSFPSNSMQERF